MMENKETKQKKVKKKSEKNSKFISWLHWFVSKIYFLIFGYKVKYNNHELKNLDGGYILIANHYTDIDHFIMAGGMKCKQISYVVSSHFILQKKTAWAIKLMRAITKEQFKNDITAIRRIKRVIDEKGIVYIAPTGQVTLTGTDNFIPKSIVKLIRLAKAPVVVFQEKGAHLAKPKWSTSKRRYPIEVNVFKLLSKEDIEILSDDEIFDKISEALDVNDYLDQKKKQIPIKSKAIIEGLEGALYMCPKCGKKLENHTHINTMRCMACGNTVFMDRFGYLHPTTKEDKCFELPYDWYRYQKEEVRKEILKKKFEVVGDVILRLYDENKKDMIDAGFGKLVLNDEEFYYEGTEYGKEIKKVFDLEHMIQTPFSPHSHLEVPDNEKFYQFKPIDKKMKIIIYVIGIDVLYEMRTKGEIKQ